MEERKRIEWIDYAKVIGIWLVVLGHILNAGRPIESELHTLIYSFHMPFFFFVSGLLFSTKDMGFGAFAVSKIKSLIVPYILLNVLCLILSIPIYLYPDVFPTTNLHTLTEDLPTLLDGEFGCVFAPPSWFLITLFFVMLISYFVTKLNIWWQVLVVALAIAMTYVAVIYQFPLNIDTIPGAFVFFIIGQMLKERVRDINMNGWLLLLLSISILIVYSCLALFNGPVQINHIFGRTSWLFWIVAMIGIGGLYILANMKASLHTHTHTHGAPSASIDIRRYYINLMPTRDFDKLYNRFFSCESLVPYTIGDARDNVVDSNSAYMRSYHLGDPQIFADNVG